MVTNIKLPTEEMELSKDNAARLKHKYLLLEKDGYRKKHAWKIMTRPNMKSDTARLSTISLTFERA